jgi:hypothetical protein
VTDHFIRSSLPRYGRTPRQLLRDPSMPDRAVRLYGLLDDYSGTDERVFPRRSVIAGSLGCSVDSVDRAITRLEDAGWLQVVPRIREDGGQTTNLYVLTNGPQEGAAPMRPPRRTRAATPAAPVRPQEGEPLEGETPVGPQGGGRANGVATAAPVGDTGNMSQPTATSSRRREVPDSDPKWATFWEWYPRKVGKGAARRAWVRALGKAGSADVLIDGAKREQAALVARRRNPRPEDRGRDLLEFVPHPATWLNQERWSDETPLQGKTEDGRLAPPRKDQECSIHAGEHRDHCRGCAADRKAKE